jgi:hypothetical protein
MEWRRFISTRWRRLRRLRQGGYLLAEISCFCLFVFSFASVDRRKEGAAGKNFR